MQGEQLAYLRMQPRWAGLRGVLARYSSEPATLVYVVLFLLVANLTVVPIAMLVLSSVNLGPIAREGGATLAFFVQGWTSPTTYVTLFNTLIFGVGSALLTVLLGGFFAFMVERTDMPFKSLIYIAVTLTIAMPGMLYGFAWILLLSERIGIFNQILLGLFSAQQGLLTSWAGIGLTEPPIKPYTMGTMIVVEALHGVGVVFLMTVGIFRNMDPSLEDAAAVSGAPARTVASRVTLRLLMPGLLAAFLYLLLSAFESFDIPLVLGLPGNVYVLSTKIFLLTRVDDQGGAAALSVVFLLIALGTVLLYGRLTRRAHSFSTVTGKGYRPRVMKTGRFRYYAGAFTMLYFLVVVVAPFSILLWASLTGRFYQVPSWEALRRANLSAYVYVMTNPGALNAMKNTLVLMVSVATSAMLIAVLISWFVMRSKMHGKRLLDVLSFSPHALPTIVIGLAFIYTFLTVPWRWLGLYGTVWIIMLALLTRYLPFATRTTHSAILQLHRELEEAALTSAASWRTMVFYIVLPLLFPAIVSGWVFVGMQALKNLTLPLLLQTPSSRTFSLLMWDNWQSGEMGLASAVGVVLMLVIGMITLLARVVEQHRARRLGATYA